jgi:2-C-methyl-D-erythritol 4-phosphate cytidylyltransferase
VAVALLVAAGSGKRLGAGRPKALVDLAGRPMLEWSLDALRAVEEVERISVALPPGEDAPEGTVTAPGGTVRSESVRSALDAVGEGDPVLVHDAARPLAEPELFERTLRELEDSGCDGAVAAAPVSDTIKEVGEDRSVVSTLDRGRLWAVQTPQAFRREALERALDVAPDVLAAATDDAWLVERAGGSVCVVEAPPENLKITTPSDLRIAEALLGQRPEGNVAVLRRIVESFDRGEPEAAFAHYADDILWDVSRFDVAGFDTVPDQDDQVFRGHEGVRRFWRLWLSAWRSVGFEYEDFIAAGDHVVSLVRMRAVGRRSGAALETPPYALVWTFRAGQVVAMHMFSDRDEALRFAGVG